MTFEVEPSKPGDVRRSREPVKGRVRELSQLSAATRKARGPQGVGRCGRVACVSQRGAGELGMESRSEKRFRSSRVGSVFYIEVYLTIKNGSY